MAQKYTVAQAKAKAESRGVAWTPDVEKRLRDAGLIEDEKPKISTAKEALLALGELMGAGTMRPNAYGPAQRAAVGSSAGDQIGAGVVTGGTFGHVTGERMGVSAPTTGVGRFANMFGQGVGVGAAMMPMTKPISLATQGIARPALQAAARGALGFGAYEGLAPADSARQRILHVLEGAGKGAAVGAAPMAPILRSIGRLPVVGRPAVGYGTFTALGALENMMAGVPAGTAIKESAYSALPMMMGNEVVHMAASPSAPARLQKTPAEMEVAPEPAANPATGAPSRGRRRGLADRPVDQLTGRATHQYVEGEPTSIPLVDYLNGKIDALAMSRQLADMGTDPSAQVIQQVMQGGKVGKLNVSEAQFIDRRRGLRAAGGGEFDSPIVKEALRVGQFAEMAREKMALDTSKAYLEALTSAGIKRNSPEAEAFARISELATDTGKHPRELAATPEGAAIMSKAANPEAVFKTFDEVQKVEAAQGEIMNNGLIATGKEPIDLRTYHQARIEKQYSLVGRKGRDFLKAIEQRTRPQDVGVQSVGPQEVWSAREQARSTPILKPDQISYDPFHIAEKYAREVARTFTNRIGVKQGENVAELLRQRASTVEDPMESADLHATADAISAITQMAYNGKLLGISGAATDATNANRGGKAVRIVDQLIAKGFNQARYIGNIRFMMSTQWTSVLMAAGQDYVSPAMMARAMKEVGTRRLGDEYKKSYSHWAKTRNAGSIMHEGDLSAGAARNPLAEHGRPVVAKAAERIKEFVGVPTREIEDIVGRLTYAIAEQVGIRAGFRGDKLENFKSDSVGLTQSFYDRTNRAPFLSTPVVRTMFPAQGFNFDVGNTYLTDIRRGQLGSKSSMSGGDKALASVRVFTSLALANAVYSLMGSQEETAKGKIKDTLIATTLGSVPYASSYLGLTPSKGRGFPAQMVEENVKAAKYFGKGEWEKGFAVWAANILPGGSQTKRAIEAKLMLERGIITERELTMAMMFGWDWTPSGKEYLRKFKGNGSDESSNNGRSRNTARRENTARRRSGR